MLYLDLSNLDFFSFILVALYNSFFSFTFLGESTSTRSSKSSNNFMHSLGTLKVVRVCTEAGEGDRDDGVVSMNTDEVAHLRSLFPYLVLNHLLI